MPTMRDNPYGAFKFLVSLGGADEGSVVAGFSDVSGLGTELGYSEYRNGNDKLSTVRKIPNTYKNEDVTLKRGLMGSADLYEWIHAVRQGEDGRRSVLITLLDEAHNAVATFKLMNAQPKKWVGPTLAAKGGGEVAMEELHLVHEGIEYQ
jgi:phage tail-like protein